MFASLLALLVVRRDTESGNTGRWLRLEGR